MFNICSSFLLWCKTSLYCCFIFLDCIITSLVLNQRELWLHQFPHLCSCDPYLCSALPLSPAAALFTGNDTFFACNYHAFSAGLDWLCSCNFESNDLISYQEECNITYAQQEIWVACKTSVVHHVHHMCNNSFWSENKDYRMLELKIIWCKNNTNNNLSGLSFFPPLKI